MSGAGLRIPCAVLGVAAIAAGLVLLRPPRPPPPGGLLPDVGGPIVLAAATASSARRSPLRSASIITALGRTLPRRIELLLLTNDRDAFELERSGRIVRFVELSPETSLTIWPQDPFLVLSLPDGGPALLASRDFARAGDREMAGALARALGWELRTAPLYFEGGNIVSDEDTIFIGADTIVRNARELELEPEAVAKRFAEELGRRVVVLGPSPQPVPHIDLAVTPLGDGRLLVGDARRGADLAQQVLDETPELAARFEQRLRGRFFGDPGIDSVRMRDGSLIEPPLLEGGTRRAIEASRRLAPHLDAIARGLADMGFGVERVAFLAGPRRSNGPEEAEVGGTGEPRDANGDFVATGPGYPTLSYDNVLVERVDGARRVYLPRYGFAPLDEAAARTWRALGFVVIPVDGLETSAMYGGALRCGLKVLARGP